MAAFSSADQRRRRCTDVITSTRSMFPVIDTVILLVLNQGVDPVRFFRGPLQFTTLTKLLKNENGATAIEYGLIAALIAVAAVTIMGTVGQNLTSIFTTVAADL